MVTTLLGKKIGMTRVFTEDGRWIPVTLLEAGPCTVVQCKTRDIDGYDAVQVGVGVLKESRRRKQKPRRGHCEKAGVEPKRTLRELRVGPDSELKVGDEIKADLFAVGDRVDIAATSKGKGFAGVIKRHGFSGGPGGHGSHFHRAPGSIGQSADPAHVDKGKRMPGHMGNERITEQNLEVLQVDVDKNLILVAGSVPGPAGGLVEVKKSVKGSN